MDILSALFVTLSVLLLFVALTVFYRRSAVDWLNENGFVEIQKLKVWPSWSCLRHRCILCCYVEARNEADGRLYRLCLDQGWDMASSIKCRYKQPM